MRKLLLVLLWTTSMAGLNAQHRIYELMERTDVKLQDVEQFAKRYFDSAGTGRGTGYKQFQRWLYERKFHTDENGNYIFPQTEYHSYASRMMPNVVTNASWTPLGPNGWTYTSGWNPGTGRLSALAVHPANQNVIYVGSPGGGLWKSVNGGGDWTPLTDNNGLWMFIFAITIDPGNQNVVYVGTGNNANVLLKSTDAGATFAPTGNGPAGTIRKILVHPTNSNLVFACATNGIWRSTNAGTSWTQVHTGSKEDIEFKVDDTNTMFATGNDMVRSVDGGVTWTSVGAAAGITNTGRTLVAVTPSNPNYVYVVQASGSTFGRMYRSTDGGQTFTTTVVGSSAAGTNYFGYEASGTGTGGQATYDMALDVSPTNFNEVFIAGIICWKSTNAGDSFSPLTEWFYPNSLSYNHADVHGLFWVGTSTLYSISDGGIYKSTNAGVDWTDLSAGLGIRQFYRIACSQTDPNVITGGAQDNGSAARQTAGNWVDWLGADGMEGLVSPTNPLAIWGTSQNGSLYRSTNGGNTYSGLTSPGNGQWVTPLAIHPTNGSIIYGGWNGVYKSTNGGTSWTNLSAGSISTTLADLAVAPSNPNYIYASNGSTLFVTTNEGASWTTRSAPATINDIAISPSDPTKIWIACNSTTNRLLVSTDAGATFTNVSANLPNIVARAVVVDDKTPTGIYVGMNIGVYYKEETAATFTDYSDNLPQVAINELEIQKAAGKIRVATYGRGVWESPVASVVANGFEFNTPAPVSAACPAPATMNITLGVISNGGFSNPVTLSATAGVPAGTTVTFAPSPVTPGSSSVVTLNNANTLPAGSYVVTITGTATGATAQTRNLTFTVTPGSGPTVTTHPASQTVCASANVTFTAASAGSNLQWQVSTNGGGTWSDVSGQTGTSYTITGVTAGLNGNQYRCVASTQCGSTPSTAATLTVNTPPVITAHPADATVCAGSSINLCVTATGSNLTYQWQSSPTCAGPWTDVPGGTSACLNIPVTTNTAFRCRVSNSCASNVTSNCAAITVATTVSVTTQPADATVCDGAPVSFTVAGSGSGIIYQWQISTDGGTSYTNISGANAATYTIAAVNLTMNNNRYRCQLSNATCPTPGISTAARLTVNSLPSISAHPASVTVCTGANHTFSITGSGAGTSYQWQLSTDGGTTYNNIGGATSSTYSLTGITAAMNNNRYRCVIGGTCTPAAISNAAVLTVISPVTVATQPANAVICSGSNTSFTVSGNSAQAIIYQWEVNNGSGFTAISNGGVYSGATTATLNITNATVAMTNYQYRCQLSNATCPATAASNAATLTVRALPVVGLTASPLTSLLPGQTTTLTATPSSSTGGVLTTSWLYNGAAAVPPITGNTYIANVEKTGTYQVLIQETFTAPALTCSNQSPVVTINAPVSNNLFIFPSPNDGTFTVSYYNSTGASTARTVTVYDAKGAQVYTAKFQINGPYTLLNVDIRPAQTGVYFVVVGDASGKVLTDGKVIVH